MSETEKVTVALPIALTGKIRQLVEADRAASISEYVAEAVEAKLQRDQSLMELRELFDRKGHSPSAEHLAWARDMLGVNDDDPDRGRRA